MVTKKKVSLPNHVLKILLRDIELFDISKDDFMNQLISNVKCQYDQLTIKKMGKSILFNLNSVNERFIKEFSKEHLEESESSVIRRIIMTYIDLPQYKRELLIFKQSVEIIDQAIKARIKLYIEIKGRGVVISPYFLINSDEGDHNYLFSYCEEFQEFHVYKLCNINKKNIRILDFSLDENDSEYIENIKENFDPFLSYGHKIKVRFEAEGVRKLIDTPYNRPKVIEVNKDTWNFECSDQKAVEYFSSFGSNVEILEPLSLREYFMNHFDNGLTMYKRSKI